MSGKKPQAGEWWRCDDNSIARVVGVKINGVVAAEHECGTMTFHSRTNLWTHLPDCTGFDWQPETFPQYYINVKWGFCDAAYVVRDTKTTYYGVQENGERHPATLEWDAVNDQLVVQLDWKQVTQAEAESRVKKPEPVESPDDWVTQDRVPARPGIDQRAYLRATDTEVDADGWMDAAAMQWSQMPIHGHRVNGFTIQVRCRRRDLPPIPQKTPKPNYVRLWTHRTSGTVCTATDERYLKYPDIWTELKHDGTGFYLEDGK
jgi:hypothetical protein